MNDEIKEILENCEKAINEASGHNDTADNLLDYITNLQQENNNLKTSLDESQEVVIDLQQENERLKTKTKEQSLLLIDYQDMEQKLEDYKSRIEKAINKLKEIKYDLDYEPWSFYNTEGKILFDLVNILNGRSDE